MNEISAAETPKLQAQLSELTSKLPKKTINESLVTLQKAVQEKTANYEQSEEERETIMAKRRVSLSRMKESIDKMNMEINAMNNTLADVENKLRIMNKSSSQSHTRIKPAPGSKIPVPR